MFPLFADQQDLSLELKPKKILDNRSGQIVRTFRNADDDDGCGIEELVQWVSLLLTIISRRPKVFNEKGRLLAVRSGLNREAV